ncbi:uncharacterized protein LOC112173604 [Rosa chinensis]|uniref:uncharacterized protein LOC112173604 n=1 Tax=Rosa chinensis TaxID=74649 RepID=UPI000D092115|nr:uncharacterized protein LOC112173604 [Rosa chinensis]
MAWFPLLCITNEQTCIDTFLSLQIFIQKLGSNGHHFGKKINLTKMKTHTLKFLEEDSGPPEWHPASPGLKSACQDATLYCKARGKNISKPSMAGFQYGLSNKDFLSGLVGMNSLKQNKRRWTNHITPAGRWD